MKRRSKLRRRIKSNKLNFQRLEDRQLLAGDLAGSHQVEAFLPTGANIVVNGDFEAFTAGADNFYDESEVPGWNAFDSATGQEINLLNWNVAGYGSVMDMDSTTTDFDRVYQDLTTEQSTEYLIAFDYRKHTTFDANATPFTHDFEVWWNESLVGRFTGGEKWNTSVIKVTSNTALDTTRLLFCEVPSPSTGQLTGDGRGAFIDNVRVVKANEVSVTNGSFENTTGESELFFKPGEVEGWTSIAAKLGDRKIQVVTGDASAGGRYMNLDTTAEHRDMVSHDMTTKTGATYYVTFDMKTDGEQTTNPDELRVRWNNEWASTIFGTNSWETYGLVLTADSTESQLMFLEPGDSSGEGSGPLIDNVRMFEISNPTSAGSLSVDANAGGVGINDVTSFVPGAGAQAVGTKITLTHPTNANLTSATITLGGAVDGSSELLSISNSTLPTDGSGNAKITVTTYNASTQTLTLTGDATVEEYQAVLRSLTYFNNAETVSTTNRLINVAIRDTNLAAGFQDANAEINMIVITNQAAIDDAKLTKFIADNSLNATNLGSGLYIVIDEPGTGLNPTINSVVRATYDGKFIELNSANKFVETASFEVSSETGFVTSLSSVIQGWGLGFPALMTGGSGKLLIPSHLAYGATGQGSIGPNTILIFDVGLLEIIS